MPLDAVYIACLGEELKGALVGMKIDKIRQPEKDTVVLALRGNGTSRKLLLCFGGGNARICFTEADYENPAQPPMFCMLLRKHLTGARILEVTQPERERMLLLRLLAYDEMGQAGEKTLAVELLGRNANLILVDGEGRIIDCARRIDEEMSPLRQLLPGLIYRLPPKPEPGKFSGLSPLLRREAELLGREQTPEGLAGIAFAPYLLTENGEPKDFSVMPILQYGAGVESVRRESFSGLLEEFYARRDRAEHLKSRARSMTKLVRSAKARTERKLALRIEELGATEDRERDKRMGDLITANIWRMKPGMDEVTVEDFYEEDCPSVTVKLDRRKTPQQNAAAFYKQYTKKKAAREHLTGLIEENRAEAEYLASVAEELERAQSQQDISDIRQELEKGGYIRISKKEARTKSKPAGPMRFTTKAGLEILVGRNNLQNDELTLKTARRTDRWFHAQKMHGAHVILCCHDMPPDEQSVYEAACLAAFYSEGAAGGRVPVDMTEVRFVKKPHGARPGMVIYTEQKTIIAEAKNCFEV